MLPLGRIAGHRGRHGELTVKVLGGDGSLWAGIARVWIGADDGKGGKLYEVESSRAYRDRLVLKLEGVDRAHDAEALRGQTVRARDEDAPRLPEDVYYVDRLIGMRARLEDGSELGRVVDLIRTGGADLLVIRTPPASPADSDEEEDERDSREVMIPLARQIVIEVSQAEGFITVRPPEGLLELNRPESPQGEDERSR
jgi:16S rRNA processing protein RimM